MLKSFRHLSDQCSFFLKCYCISLSINNHPNAFAFLNFFASAMSGRSVDIQAIFATLHFIRDNIGLLEAIPQSFSNCEHYANDDITGTHFNNLKADFGPASERNTMKRSNMIVNINFLSKSNISIFDLKVIDILSDGKWFKDKLIEAIGCYCLFLLLFFGLEIIGKLIIISSFIVWLSFFCLGIIKVCIFNSGDSGAILVIMNKIFTLACSN